MIRDPAMIAVSAQAFYLPPSQIKNRQSMKFAFRQLLKPRLFFTYSGDNAALSYPFIGPFSMGAHRSLPLDSTAWVNGRGRSVSEVAGVGGHEQALERSVAYQLSYGEFRILSIDALIAAKEAAGRERDQEAVRYLRAIKERNEQRTDG